MFEQLWCCRHCLSLLRSRLQRPFKWESMCWAVTVAIRWSTFELLFCLGPFGWDSGLLWRLILSKEYETKVGKPFQRDLYVGPSMTQAGTKKSLFSFRPTLTATGKCLSSKWGPSQRWSALCLWEAHSWWLWSCVKFDNQKRPCSV